MSALLWLVEPRRSSIKRPSHFAAASSATMTCAQRDMAPAGLAGDARSANARGAGRAALDAAHSGSPGTRKNEVTAGCLCFAATVPDYRHRSSRTSTPAPVQAPVLVPVPVPVQVPVSRKKEPTGTSYRLTRYRYHGRPQLFLHDCGGVGRLFRPWRPCLIIV